MTFKTSLIITLIIAAAVTSASSPVCFDREFLDQGVTPCSRCTYGVPNADQSQGDCTTNELCKLGSRKYEYHSGELEPLGFECDWVKEGYATFTQNVDDKEVSEIKKLDAADKMEGCAAQDVYIDDEGVKTSYCMRCGTGYKHVTTVPSEEGEPLKLFCLKDPHYDQCALSFTNQDGA